MNRAEFEKRICSASFDDVLKFFSADWFNRIFIDAKNSIGCGQGNQIHYEGDVAVHTAHVFVNTRSCKLANYGVEPNFIEFVAALQHDLCKWRTRVEMPDGHVNFPGHEAMAADMVAGIAERLKLSELEAKQLEFVVRYHGEVHSWPHLSNALKNELVASPWFLQLVLLQEADAKSCIVQGGGHLPVYREEMLGYKISDI